MAEGERKSFVRSVQVCGRICLVYQGILLYGTLFSCVVYIFRIVYVMLVKYVASVIFIVYCLKGEKGILALCALQNNELRMLP